jgi:hypothetical protein
MFVIGSISGELSHATNAKRDGKYPRKARATVHVHPIAATNGGRSPRRLRNARDPPACPCEHERNVGYSVIGADSPVDRSLCVQGARVTIAAGNSEWLER